MLEAAMTNVAGRRHGGRAGKAEGVESGEAAVVCHSCDKCAGVRRGELDRRDEGEGQPLFAAAATHAGVKRRR